MKYKQRPQRIMTGTLLAAVAALLLLAQPPAGAAPVEAGSGVPADPPAAPVPQAPATQTPAPNAPRQNGAKVALPLTEAASAADWAATLDRIANSVVTIEIDQARSFDTERNMSAQATGFVVDAQRGLILTNRHVVTPGPVTAMATFLDREEVQLYPVYRDPVHDFGFYRYDPSKLKYIHPQALPLVPQDAQVGREIRVVGNNAGEQLSILAGTLARLDREAPDYGVGRYNDFNTFYIQAASGTSGGSSGSPVVDIQGHVLALNAGGASGAASSFYLPLARVRRALHSDPAGQAGHARHSGDGVALSALRRAAAVGTDGCAPRPRCASAEPGGTGMLVVVDVQPGSVSDGVLEPGDVLVRVNGELVTRFDPLEAVLDDSVGKTVELTLLARRPAVHRRPQGRRPRRDHSGRVPGNRRCSRAHTLVRGGARLSPSDPRCIRRGVRLHLRGCGGAARCDHHRGQLQAGRIARRLHHGDRGLRRRRAGRDALRDHRRSEQQPAALDPHRPALVPGAPLSARRCRIGYWQCVDAARGRHGAGADAATAQLPQVDDPRAAPIAPSLVYITFNMPYTISGVTERYYHGAGLIIDAQRGLIITDRDTVPVSLGDVRLTFGGTIEIPGKIVYVHPLHDLAVIHYDPSLHRQHAGAGRRSWTRSRSSPVRPSMWSGWTATAISRRAPPRIADVDAAGAAVVALGALSRQQSGCGLAGEPAGRCRRRAVRQRRPRARPVGELRLRQRPRAGTGDPRHLQRPGGRDARPRAQRAAAAFAGGGVRAADAGLRASARTRPRLGCSASRRPIPSTREVLSVERLVGGSDAAKHAAARRHPARDRRPSRSPNSVRSSAP